MEDQDPPIDAMLRGKALQMAISAYVAVVPHSHLDPDDTHSDCIVSVARTFYNFLKGDNK